MAPVGPCLTNLNDLLRLQMFFRPGVQWDTLSTMPGGFPDELTRLIKGSYSNFTAFARVALPDLEENSAQGTVGMIRSGRSPLPTKRIEAFADALHLPPGSPARRRFRRLAICSHLPPEVRDEILAELERLDRIEARAAAVLAEEQAYPRKVAETGGTYGTAEPTGSAPE